MTPHTVFLCLQAGCENGINKKSNVTGTTCGVLMLNRHGHRDVRLTRFSSCSLLRCGLSAAPAAFAERPGRGALSNHQGPAGGAAAGRRSAGGVPGPDTPHPQGPAGCLCPTQRNIKHTHSGRERSLVLISSSCIIQVLYSFLFCRIKNKCRAYGKPSPLMFLSLFLDRA